VHSGDLSLFDYPVVEAVELEDDVLLLLVVVLTTDVVDEPLEVVLEVIG
jgi:hypothetical protein